jgi:hypothetical protein
MSTQTESCALKAEFMAMIEQMTPDELDRLHREGCALLEQHILDDAVHGRGLTE